MQMDALEVEIIFKFSKKELHKSQTEIIQKYTNQYPQLINIYLFL